jgi:hypothetical protein
MNLPLPANLIATGLALLAFVVAFYVLIARERKTPYIINFIFKPSGFLLLGILLAFSAELIRVSQTQNPAVSPSSPPGASSSSAASTVSAPSRTMKWVSSGAVLSFSFGLILTISNFWRLYNRQVNFRDDNKIKNMRFARWLKRKHRQWKDTPVYSQSRVVMDEATINKALAAGGLVSAVPDQQARTRTIAICGKPLQETTQQLLQTCVELIKSDWYVQYTTCIRHPWEFTEMLNKQLDSKWNDLAKRIVVVDAYTPHFGFTDSVHEDKTLLVKKSNVNYVAARESYAGLHTAAAAGFNKLKELDKGNRRPTIVIYEGANALADLESREQYRIFARHVLTSERMWGGMLTVFVEPAIASDEMSLLRTYADVFVAQCEGKSGKSV